MSHIIIVEEEPMLRNLFVKFTEALCPPSTLISGTKNDQQALDVYEETAADLIITDFEIPSLTGPQLIHGLRSKGVQIPIVVTSDTPEAVPLAYEAGATLFVDKAQFIKFLPTIISRYLPRSGSQPPP